MKRSRLAGPLTLPATQDTPIPDGFPLFREAYP